MHNKRKWEVIAESWGIWRFEGSYHVFWKSYRQIGYIDQQNLDNGDWKNRAIKVNIRINDRWERIVTDDYKKDGR